MDGVAVIRVIRQVRVIRYANINEPGPNEPLVQQQPLPQRNNRCLNAFVLLTIYFIGIGSIVIGSLHLNDCPAERMLPTGLVVFGGLLMVSRLLNCVYDCRSICEEENQQDAPPCLILLNLLFCLAEFGMFIALCYYAFSMKPDVEDSALKNYCDNTLYKTSYYGCIVGLIFYTLPVLCGCCVACSR